MRKLVISNGEPIHDLMIRGDREWREHPMYREFGARERLRHYCASPICVGGLVRGALGYARLDGAAPIDARDLLDLTTISLHVQDRFAQLEGHRPRARFDGMTDRQLEICRHVSRGSSNLEIARQLGVTTDGVKAHLERIFVLLGIESRDDLTAEYLFWFPQRE